MHDERLDREQIPFSIDTQRFGVILGSITMPASSIRGGGKTVAAGAFATGGAVFAAACGVVAMKSLPLRCQRISAD